jgi:hypothetical protein
MGQRLVKRILVGAVFAVALAAWSGASAAPKAALWERWTAHDAASAAEIDHGPWNRLLAAYRNADASGIALFDYSAVTEADDAVLGRYLAGLSAVAISRYSRPEQLAFWFNLYNAITVEVVLEHYPVVTIRDIDAAYRIGGPWRKKRITIEGERLSLDDIEHRIVRPIWRDPRVHYAFNCAAMGCPNLPPAAFTAANTEALLEAAARDYVNHPRGVTVEDGQLRVSKIYKWYRADFGGDDAGVIAHLRRYAAPGLRDQLDGISRIARTSYNWRLNDARIRTTPGN